MSEIGQPPSGQLPGTFGTPPGEPLGHPSATGGFGQPPSAGDFGTPPQGPSGTWSPMDAIAYAFGKIKADPAGILLPFLVAGLCMCMPAMFLYGFAIAALALLDSTTLYLLSMLVSLSVFAVSTAFLTGGGVLFCLRICRGEPYSIGDFFSASGFMVHILVGLILHTVAVNIGFLLCIVPGIILSVGLYFWPLVAIDQRSDGIEALKKSWEATDGHKAKVFVFLTLNGLISLVGAMCCYIGLIFTMPLWFLSATYVYLRLTEQPVV
ncbi:MAG: YciC family protein [Myxococcota bacterium]